MTRRVIPYSIAVGGAIAVTIAIELISFQFATPGLSSFYLLLVLWLGTRWGRGPAVAGSVAAFLLYDFFFVPPVGTLSVRGPAELLELVVLLAIALVTSQLAASLRRAQSAAEAIAGDSRALYELATATLRANEVTGGLEMVSDSATRLAGVDRFAVAAIVSGHATQLAGSALTTDEMKQAQ